MKRLLTILGFFPIFLYAQFDGAVGTEGCRAISCTDPNIKSWATGCEVTRGYQDIKRQQALADYGNAGDATGPVTESTLEVVSLGDGGYAILSFDTPISNGPGYDFAVFENSFDDVFLELAFVEVSSDGEHWVRFPATSLTPEDVQVGSYGTVDPRLINNLAGKYRVGWGTPFDLAELADSNNLDINHITHVKIVDVIGTIDPEYATYDAFGHIVNDPYPTNFGSGGFDLAGIAVLNQGATTGITEYGNADFTIYPNPCRNYLWIEQDGNADVVLYNAFGQEIARYVSGGNKMKIDMTPFPSGIYLISVDGNSRKMIKQ